MNIKEIIKNDYALSSPVRENVLVEDVEEFLEELDNDDALWQDCKPVEEIKQLRIEQSKAVQVHKRKYARVRKEWLWDKIVDYLDDHYGNGEIDVYPNGEHIFDKFIEEFNNAQNAFIGDGIVGTIDLSKQVTEYFKLVEEEEL